MNNITGYFCAAFAKDGDDGFMIPLAYGDSRLPEQDMLLRDRGASVFPTLEDARRALQATLKRADELEHEWPSLFLFDFIPVRLVDS